MICVLVVDAISHSNPATCGKPAQTPSLSLAGFERGLSAAMPSGRGRVAGFHPQHSARQVTHGMAEKPAGHYRIAYRFGGTNPQRIDNGPRRRMGLVGFSARRGCRAITETSRFIGADHEDCTRIAKIAHAGSLQSSLPSCDP